MPLHRPGDRELLNTLGSGADKAEIHGAGKGLSLLPVQTLLTLTDKIWAKPLKPVVPAKLEDRINLHLNRITYR